MNAYWHRHFDACASTAFAALRRMQSLSKSPVLAKPSFVAIFSMVLNMSLMAFSMRGGNGFLLEGNALLSYYALEGVG